MPASKAQNAGRRVHFLYSWHRWLGLSAALFIIILAITGLALNHSDELGLDRTGLEAKIWHQIYGLSEEVELRAWPVAGHWLVYSEGRLYFDDQFVAQAPQPLGTAELGNFVVVASAAELILLANNGTLLERIAADQLPGRVTGLAKQGDRLLLQTPYALFAGDLDSLNWQLQPDRDIATALPADASNAMPEAMHASISQDIRSHRLTLERLLLDLHSGRLFGQLGRTVMDGAALVMLALTLTGPWLWLRLRRRLRKRRIRAPQT